MFSFHTVRGGIVVSTWLGMTFNKLQAHPLENTRLCVIHLGIKWKWWGNMKWQAQAGLNCVWIIV